MAHAGGNVRHAVYLVGDLLDCVCRDPVQSVSLYLYSLHDAEVTSRLLNIAGCGGIAAVFSAQLPGRVPCIGRPAVCEHDIVPLRTFAFEFVDAVWQVCVGFGRLRGKNRHIRSLSHES